MIFEIFAMTVTILGVYPVPEAKEPCHLIELEVRDYDGELNMEDVTQETQDQPRDSWQVPYIEYVLDRAGEKGREPEPGRTIQVAGAVRLAFFLHYIDFNRPLLAFGNQLKLPKATERPKRLAFISYEPPD